MGKNIFDSFALLGYFLGWEIFPNSKCCHVSLSDLVKFVLVSKDCVPFGKYTKLYVYSRNQDTHEKLNQIRKTSVVTL